eukprot:scaffold6625_cov146-Isochrysis_galbana.AAC.3
MRRKQVIESRVFYVQHPLRRARRGTHQSVFHTRMIVRHADVRVPAFVRDDARLDLEHWRSLRAENGRKLVSR